MIIQMAWRNVWRHKARSLVIIISIAIGLLSGVFIMGLYQGMLQARLKVVIEREVSHLQLHHENFKDDFAANYTVPEWERLRGLLPEIPGIKAFAARTIAHGMLATTTGSSGVQINGIEPDRENEVSQLYSKRIAGKGFDETRHNQIWVGKKLADKLKIKVGNKIVLTLTDKDDNITSGAFRVSGVYQTENGPLDEQNVFVRGEDLNQLMGLNDRCHEVAILLWSESFLPVAVDRLKEVNPLLKVETWKELSPETDLMIETTDTYSIIFVTIILLALMFGIINTMLMAVLERTREIGMLIALGMNKVRLFLLVLWETFFLTLIGAPMGIALAWAVITRLGEKGIDISKLAGEAMSSFGFSSSVYPQFPWLKLPEVLIIVCLTALLSSLLPSYKAMRLAPVDAMRL